MGGRGRGSGRGSAWGPSARTAFLNTLLTSHLGTEAVLKISFKKILAAASAAGRLSEQKEAAPRPVLSLTAGLCWILFPRQSFQLNEALFVLSKTSWLLLVVVVKINFK